MLGWSVVSEEKISNEELVNTYNTYVKKFNTENKSKINDGSVVPMEYSSVEFIEKASGIKSRHVIDKEGILDINRMMPRVQNELEGRMSAHVEAGIKASLDAMKQANVTPEQIDGVIVGTSHSARNYPAIAIEIQNELNIKVMHTICLLVVHQLFAINNAFSDIASGLAVILVVNPEINTPGVDFTRRIIILFWRWVCCLSNSKK